MRVSNLRCPKCDKKLKMDISDSVAHCDACGYDFVVGNPEKPFGLSIKTRNDRKNYILEKQVEEKAKLAEEREKYLKEKRNQILIMVTVVCMIVAIIVAICAPASKKKAEDNNKNQVLVSSTTISTTTKITEKKTTNKATETTKATTQRVEIDYSKLDLKYSGKPYVVLDDEPDFSKSGYSTSSFTYYSPLDSLGRCGVCYACVGKDIMPTESRGEIGQIKPSGWHTVRYDDLISDMYLYNRCHLIGYQLTGNNSDEKNLITGTRYLNVSGMLQFENEVFDYVDSTNNHVYYRVTPDFREDELVARGIQIEALSIEDDGAGICFNVYCFNVQPGIVIDYATGNSKREVELTTSAPIVSSTTTSAVTTSVNSTSYTYVLNKNSKKFHYADCSSVRKMKDRNKEMSNENRDQIIARGYSPCGICNP